MLDTTLTPSPRDRALDLIKWLALGLMLVDHLRHVWPSLYFLYAPGRLAFPFFCLAIAANALRSAQHPFAWRYLGWLLAFALLSEWPYRVLLPGAQSLNVMPTLLLGLLIASGLGQPWGTRRWVALAALLVAGLAHPWLMFGMAGALLPAGFVYALQQPGQRWPVPVLLCLAANYWPPFYVDALRGDLFACTVILTCIAVPLLGLWLLRQRLSLRVPPVRRWAYLFYPAHFLLLAGLQALLH